MRDSIVDLGEIRGDFFGGENVIAILSVGEVVT